MSPLIIPKKTVIASACDEISWHWQKRLKGSVNGAKKLGYFTLQTMLFRFNGGVPYLEFADGGAVIPGRTLYPLVLEWTDEQIIVFWCDWRHGTFAYEFPVQIASNNLAVPYCSCCIFLAEVQYLLAVQQRTLFFDWVIECDCQFGLFAAIDCECQRRQT